MNMPIPYIDEETSSRGRSSLIGSQKSSRSVRSSSCTPGSSCKPNAVGPYEPKDGETKRDVDLLRGLDFLWLELTSKCNLHCVHCYADSGPSLPLVQRMAYADWLRVLAEAARLGCRKVQFIGGEPTIYPQLPELMGEARHLGYEFVEVFTNGTVFAERIKQAFLAHKIHIAFSVYSSTAVIHDSITLRQGSFEKTKANIQWALRAGLTVRVAIIEMEENASEVGKTQKDLEELGVREIQVDRVRGIGRGSANRETELHGEDLCGRCWEGKLCVTSEGQMFPCVFSRRWLVGTVQESIENVVQGAPLLSFRSNLQSKAGAQGIALA